jgi:hypothetical protein
VSKPKPTKLEDIQIWKNACELGEFMYSVLENFPEEEKWATVSKLRNSANDLIFYVGQAVGDGSISASRNDWNNARRHASGMKTMYRFAGRQKFVTLDPEIMVKIDRLIEEIDENLEIAKDQFDLEAKADLKPWLEKYRIWKEMNT